MNKIAGIIGLGIMGGAIARNLVDRGWRVIGFDIDATRRAELGLAGVTIAADVGHIARDCPLSGTGAQAKNRDLVVYASGDSNAVAQCQSLFADFAKQSADLGKYGNGSRMKFVANHLGPIHNVATAEAMVLGGRGGRGP